MKTTQPTIRVWFDAGYLTVHVGRCGNDFVAACTTGFTVWAETGTTHVDALNALIERLNNGVK